MHAGTSGIASASRSPGLTPSKRAQSRLTTDERALSVDDTRQRTLHTLGGRGLPLVPLSWLGQIRQVPGPHTGAGHTASSAPFVCTVVLRGKMRTSGLFILGRLLAVCLPVLNRHTACPLSQQKRWMHALLGVRSAIPARKAECRGALGMASTESTARTESTQEGAGDDNPNVKLAMTSYPH